MLNATRTTPIVVFAVALLHFEVVASSTAQTNRPIRSPDPNQSGSVVPNNAEIPVTVFQWHPSRGLYQKHNCTVRKLTEPAFCRDLLKQCIDHLNLAGLILESKIPWMAYDETDGYFLSVYSDCGEAFLGHRFRFGQYNKSMENLTVSFPVAKPRNYDYDKEGTLLTSSCDVKLLFIPRTCDSLIRECYHKPREWNEMIPYRRNRDSPATPLSPSDNCEDVFTGDNIYFAAHVKLGQRVTVTIYPLGRRHRRIHIYYTVFSTPQNIFHAAFTDYENIGVYLCAYADSNLYDSRKVYNIENSTIRHLHIIEANSRKDCKTIPQ